MSCASQRPVEVEVVDEVEGQVFTFAGPDMRAVEEAIGRWSRAGAPTWSGHRPAGPTDGFSADDLKLLPPPTHRPPTDRRRLVVGDPPHSWTFLGVAVAQAAVPGKDANVRRA